eukprot:scaffold8462_cov110-Isochrysis_galbana.AAC.4
MLLACEKEKKQRQREHASASKCELRDAITIPTRSYPYQSVHQPHAAMHETSRRSAVSLSSSSARVCVRISRLLRRTPHLPPAALHAAAAAAAAAAAPARTYAYGRTGASASAGAAQGPGGAQPALGSQSLAPQTRCRCAADWRRTSARTRTGRRYRLIG